MKCIFLIVVLLIVLPVNYFFMNSGNESLSYAGDQWGDYLDDQTPREYTEATGWRKTVGLIMVFGFLFYMGYQVLKTICSAIKDRKR